MKHSFVIFLLSILFLLQYSSAYTQPPPEHKTLAINAVAPDFALPAIDAKTYTLASFNNSKILVIIFYL